MEATELWISWASVFFSRTSTRFWHHLEPMTTCFLLSWLSHIKSFTKWQTWLAWFDFQGPSVWNCVKSMKSDKSRWQAVAALSNLPGAWPSAYTHIIHINLNTMWIMCMSLAKFNEFEQAGFASNFNSYCKLEGRGTGQSIGKSCAFVWYVFFSWLMTH